MRTTSRAEDCAALPTNGRHQRHTREVQKVGSLGPTIWLRHTKDLQEYNCTQAGYPPLLFLDTLCSMHTLAQQPLGWSKLYHEKCNYYITDASHRPQLHCACVLEIRMPTKCLFLLKKLNVSPQTVVMKCTHKEYTHNESITKNPQCEYLTYILFNNCIKTSIETSFSRHECFKSPTNRIKTLLNARLCRNVCSDFLANQRRIVLASGLIRIACFEPFTKRTRTSLIKEAVRHACFKLVAKQNKSLPKAGIARYGCFKHLNEQNEISNNVGLARYACCKHLREQNQNFEQC